MHYIPPSNAYLASGKHAFGFPQGYFRFPEGAIDGGEKAL